MDGDVNGDTIRALHVGDGSGTGTAAFLRRETDDVVPVSAADADEALTIIAERDVDCVVADYEAPDGEGIRLLRAVRERHDDLPFVLFTGAGSEATAAAAIAAGVTDYVPKRGPDSHAVLATRVRNAVEQHRARTELRRRERRLQALLQHSSDRLFIVDRENRYKWISPAVERILGYDPEELLGEPSGEYVHPDDRDELVDFDDLEPGETVSLEYRVRHADGSWRWVETRETNRLDDPAVEGIVVNSRDVTERVERERRLERERDRFETLFEALAEPAVRTSDPDGTRPIVQSVNRAFEETFGYEASELVGESLNDYIVPEDRRDEAERLDEAATDGDSAPEPVEVRRRTADGELRDFLLIDAAITAGGSYEGLLMYTDVTERNEYRRGLERQTERLDEFAGVVSHDLRNPLRAVEGSIELAREEYDDDDLDRAARALDRAFDLIDDLLTAAREGAAVTETERVALDAAAERAWNGVDADDARLVVATEATIHADEDRLLRLLGNLLRNSVEHGSTGSRPEADDGVEHGSTGDRSGTGDAAGDADSAGTAAADVTVEVGALDDGFYVADDGPGIPPDERGDVFTPGYTTVADGTGLGLYVVREIARAHDWSVELVEGDGGARFELTGVETA